MKIAMISDWYPPKRGGIETVVPELSSELASRSKVEVHVLTANHPHKITLSDRWEEGEGLKVKRLSGIILPQFARSVYFHPEMPFKLKKIFKEENYDVVHAHHLFTPLSNVATAVGKSMSPQRDCVVMTNHSYRDRSDLPFFKLFNYLATSFSNPDRITVVSEAAKKLVENMNVDLDKVRKTPYGVNTRKFTPKKESEELKEELDLDSDFLLLFVSRLIKRKGLQYVLPALKDARNECGDLGLVVVGEGPWEGKLKKMASDLDVEDSVLFLGSLGHEKVSKLYATCDAFVSPSLGNESFGLINTEAMASGAPTIASDIPGFRESFEEEAGFLVPPGDSEAIKEKILKLARDEELRKKLSKRARELAMKRYSWEKAADNFMEVYNEVLS